MDVGLEAHRAHNEIAVPSTMHLDQVSCGYCCLTKLAYLHAWWIGLTTLAYKLN